MRCAVFGATGYLGGRLVPELLAAGHQVRAVARDPAKLSGFAWRDRVDVVRDQDVVYYLVHSLTHREFADLDRAAAHTVADAARVAGVSRIVYLGGLVPRTPPDTEARPLSAHLASRSEVGRILRDGAVPTVELRAAVVLGSGSASFEMLRYLTENLPVMVTPRWARNRIQPIAVRDVLHYLVGAATAPGRINAAFDIGGPEVLTYLEMLRRYAAVAGLRRRWIVVVPLLTPWLSAQWVNLVTPVPRALAVPLVESLVHEVVCRDRSVADVIPDPPGGLTPYDRAVERALTRIRDADVPTRWSDATPGDPSEPMPSDPAWSGGSVYTDVREGRTHADPSTLWEVVESIGGETGWYSFPLAWSVRGWIDRLAGGVGLRRGRRDPRRLRPGEALDWWRVERLDPPRLLRLRAEMRLPGEAWLELRVEPDGDGGARYRQRAVFVPKGFAGHLYWKAVTPFHALVFGGMTRNITAAADGGGRARRGSSMFTRST